MMQGYDLFGVRATARLIAQSDGCPRYFWNLKSVYRRTGNVSAQREAVGLTKDTDSDRQNIPGGDNDR